jgi:hypothetical protein
VSIASRDELVAWLSHPVTVAVADELRARLERYRRALPDYVVKGKTDDARSAAGAIKAYEEFVAEFFAQPAEVAEPEPDNYRDPAERPGKET